MCPKRSRLLLYLVSVFGIGAAIGSFEEAQLDRGRAFGVDREAHALAVPVRTERCR